MYGLTECKEFQFLMQRIFQKHNSVGKPIKELDVGLLIKKVKKLTNQEPR